MFRECEYCGASLDHGERCDCQEEAERKRREEKKLYRTSRDGQVVMIFGGLRYADSDSRC